jgi:hypothetical protein
VKSLRVAPFVYVVTMWVSPKNGHLVIEWLDTTHIAEILGQPGFLWAQRVRLQQTRDDGWVAHQIIYGLESAKALDDYQKSPQRETFSRQARERFAKQGLRFEELVKAERVWGSVEKIIEAA